MTAKKFQTVIDAIAQKLADKAGKSLALGVKGGDREEVVGAIGRAIQKHEAAILASAAIMLGVETEA